MKIEGINGVNHTFKGKRLDRNAVMQLAKNNPYSLIETNQRYITQALENLSKVKGESNIRFLLETAAANKYSTNITLQDQPKNDWKTKLLYAAAKAMEITPGAMLSAVFLKDFLAVKDSKDLSEDEKDILNLREQLLGVVDLEQINNETVGSAKNFTKNLDYFIVSSETTIEHKKYVLERLNYFMSDKYEINPQLKNKKSIAAAEMINDMAINTPGSKIPNIKAVNQKQHGMCAAISIVRKKLAYEDKVNYIDSLLSELDNKDTMLVYDRSKLGSGEKTEVPKVPVDFDAALAKGYRIIDASTMHWMQIAKMSGINNISYNNYNPFDKENFDVKTDAFFHAKFSDPQMEKTQTYYQALLKAKSVLEDYKASSIKKKINKTNYYQDKNKNIEAAARTVQSIKEELASIAPNFTNRQLQELLNLEKPVSSKITQGDKFSYIPNEEEFIKKEKTAGFIKKISNINSIDEKSLDKLFSMINHYHDLTASLPRTSEIGKASQLYEIAAAFRYQIAAGLDDEMILNKFMESEDIDNKETLVLKTIDSLIEKLESNSPQSQLIIEQLHKNALDSTDGSKEQILAGLYQLKAIIEDCLTDKLDNLYAALTMGSRKDALISSINGAKNMLMDGNTQFLEDYAEILGVKKSVKHVIKALEKDEKKLINGGEKEYTEMFNKYGHSSQISYLKALMQGFINNCAQEDNSEIIANFLLVNGLDVNDDEDAFTQRLNLIAQNIDSIEQFINQAYEALKIVDKDGDVIISANPKDIIIHKLENKNQIASAKQLRELQTHLDKITKVRSSDEFQSRRGKIKDKSLTQFSNSEKALLNDIDKSIDYMYSFTQKEIRFIRSEMKDYLEELARLSGLNDGHYWVGEGSSGLAAGGQIRILEYLTGRPHYLTEDYQKAIEEIKTSPYSGLSTSSVYHDNIGMHSQYIADIEPVKVTNKEGKTEIKDVLFNDNTWGASELENTWVDSYGLTRTDYSDGRGGSLGYITNNQYRNGNFVDRILSDMVTKSQIDTTENKIYKKIKHPSREISAYPQYTDIILDGKSEGLKSTTDKIHDAIFVSNVRYLERLKKIGAEHTQKELAAMIKDVQLVGKNWKSLYENLKRRVFSINPDDYNNLKDNDYLKVVLEKIALKRNAQITGLEADIARVKDVKDLSKFRAAQKTRALNSFKYAFSKSIKVVDYLANSFGDKEFDKLETLLDNLGVKLTDEEFNSIGQSFSIDSTKFDGSAKTTINLILEGLREEINNVISDKKAQDAVENFYRDFLNEKLYFNKNDLDLTDPDNKKYAHIINFIDKVYDPESDEEFVEIYRKIQDMTSEEFKEEILSKASYEDMGVKSITGYDILKKIQHYEESANSAFINTVYYDSIVPELDSKRFETTYKYSKLSRTPRYLPDRNFKDIYRDINMDLSMLTLPKLFNKYKGNNLEKYGMYPAYPKIEYISEEFLHTSFDSAIGKIEHNIDTIKSIKDQIRNYEIAHTLKKLKRMTKQSSVIKGDNYTKINELLGELVTKNLNDPSAKEVVEAAEKALEFEEGSTIKDYRPYIDTIINRLTDYENTSPTKLLEDVIKQNKAEIDATKHAFIKGFIEERYQSRMAEALNQFEQAAIKENSDKKDALKKELYENFGLFHVINNPEELLGKYIQSCAKDGDLKPLNNVFETLLTRAIEFSRLAEIQDILMDALGDGVALNAKSNFSKHILNFGDSEFSMDSDFAVSYMTNKLITDNQFETALMFLEKLGLTEQYVKYTADTFNYDKLEELIKETFDIANNFDGFQTECNNYLANLAKQLEADNVNYKKVIKKACNEIAQLGKKYGFEVDDVAPIVKGLMTLEYNLVSNPNIQKQVLFATVMSSAQTQTSEIIAEKIEEKNNILNSSTTIMNFVNNIMLTPNSEADKKRTILNTKYETLVKLKETLDNLQGN